MKIYTPTPLQLLIVLQRLASAGRASGQHRHSDPHADERTDQHSDSHTDERANQYSGWTDRHAGEWDCL